jgi:lysozyme
MIKSMSPNLTKILRKEDVDIIKQFEGFSPVWYKDGGGVDTIGYGHTGELPHGFEPPLTEESATRLLLRDVEIYESAVKRNVRVCISQDQYAALVSFCYNVGILAFINSTLLQKLNADEVIGAANELLRWNRDNGKVVAGLVNRRVAERNLFLRGWDIA